MRVGFVQWPDGLIPDTDIWSAVAADVTRSAPEVLITNEMPFGPWLAASPNFDVERAKKSVQIHEDGLRALQALKVPIVISSRPVIAGGRLANEAFILERGCCSALNLCSMKEHGPTAEREHISSLFLVQPAAPWRRGKPPVRWQLFVPGAT